AAAPAVAVYAVIRLAIGPLSRCEHVALAAGVSLMVGVAIEYDLKYVFGRYWPDTWLTPPNPSFIGTGDYGFHLFHHGDADGSFPSGHTMRTAAVMSVIGIAYPWVRWLCAAIVLVVMGSLVGMNYHFVGDTIAGAAIGYLVGMYTAAFFKVRQASSL